MRTRNIASLLALPLSLMFFTGCQSHPFSGTYYLVSSNLGRQYWKTGISGFNAAGRLYGVHTVVVGPQNFDPQAELKALEQATSAKQVSGILISVANAPLVQGEINNAIAAGIPVLTIDSDAPFSNRIFYIGTDNLEAGQLGGQRVVDRLSGKGNVVFFTNVGQPNMEDRLNGYEKVFSEHPGIKTVQIVDIKGNSNAAFDETEKLVLLKGADAIDAFVCLDSSSCRAVAEVLTRDNIKGRLVVAMDVDPETLDFIKKGVIDSTISQKPYTMAYLGLETLAAMHRYPQKPIAPSYSTNTFSPYPKFVNTGTTLVDADDVDIYLAEEKQAEKH